MKVGARRGSRFYPQGDSFENANTDIYFRDYATHTFRSPVKAHQDHRSFRIRDTRETSTVKVKFHESWSEAQFETHLLSPLSRSACNLESTLPILHFGFIASSKNFGIWLRESLQELAECPSYAQEEEMDEPSDLALIKAKQLLERIAGYVVDRPEIYPMQQSSIAIAFRNHKSRSGALFLIERDGSGILYHRTANSKGRLRVDDAADLLKEGGIREMKRVGIR